MSECKHPLCSLLQNVIQFYQPLHTKLPSIISACVFSSQVAGKRNPIILKTFEEVCTLHIIHIKYGQSWCPCSNTIKLHPNTNITTFHHVTNFIFLIAAEATDIYSLIVFHSVLHNNGIWSSWHQYLLQDICAINVFK